MFSCVRATKRLRSLDPVPTFFPPLLLKPHPSSSVEVYVRHPFPVSGDSIGLLWHVTACGAGNETVPSVQSPYERQDYVNVGDYLAAGVARS